MLLQPRPTLTARRASSAAQRARQRAAFHMEDRDWRQWRRTLQTHETDELQGRLYRPRRSAHHADRYEAAERAWLMQSCPLGLEFGDDEDLWLLESDGDLGLDLSDDGSCFDDSCDDGLSSSFGA